MKDTNINLWSHSEFADAAKELETHISFPDKIEYIFSLFGPEIDRLELLLRPVCRIIDNERICFGFIINNSQDALEIARAIIQKFISIFYESEQVDIQKRIVEKCFTDEEKKELMKGELELIKEKNLLARHPIYTDNFYIEGYTNARIQKEFRCPIETNVSNVTLPIYYYKIENFFRYARGANTYLIEKFLSRMLNDIEPNLGRSLNDGNIKAAKSIKKSKKVFEDLDQVFYKKEYAEICYSILRNKLIIDQNNEFTGREAGEIVLWARELKRIELIRTSCTQSNLVDLLNKKFPHLDLTVYNYNKTHQRAIDNHKQYFQEALIEVKKKISDSLKKTL